jgi:serine/threonine-protein kinase
VRSDVWALGVVLFELLTASVPFHGNSLPDLIISINGAPPASLRQRLPDVPAELELIIKRCLEKDPAARYPNVGELALALAPFAPRHGAISVERIVRTVGGASQPVKTVELPPSEPAGVKPVSAAASGEPSRTITLPAYARTPPETTSRRPVPVTGIFATLIGILLTGMIVLSVLRFTGDDAPPLAVPLPSANVAASGPSPTLPPAPSPSIEPTAPAPGAPDAGADAAADASGSGSAPQPSGRRKPSPTKPSDESLFDERR